MPQRGVTYQQTRTSPNLHPSVPFVTTFSSSFLQNTDSGADTAAVADESAAATVDVVTDEKKTSEEAAAAPEEEKKEEEKAVVVVEKLVLSDASSHTIESNPEVSTGPVHTLTFHEIAGQEKGNAPSVVIETGKIGRQAAGAVTVTRGESVLYSTAARDDTPKDNLDFLPLSVEYQERFSSVGTTSGSYNKREGRLSEHEVLTCRLIDRPLRPLIADGWHHETQLLTWVLSYDGVRSSDALAITASATALYISDVPLTKPVAAVLVGYINGQLVVNPTNEQMENSKLELTVAGTKDAIMMIEGAADFLPEDIMIEAIALGKEAIKSLCEGIEEFGKAVGVAKKFDTLRPTIEGLQEDVDETMTERVDAMLVLEGVSKAEKGEIQSQLKKSCVTELEEKYPEETKAIKGAFKDLLCRRVFHTVKTTGKRMDGRGSTNIRPITSEAGFLPRVHGSALFTRGETQAIATATLGDSGMRQKIDNINGQIQKRFYLQYTFPPSCVGETGRVGAPGRREVGHGNLAERALSPTLPSVEEFPYTIRVESLITESHGSSSMASVCGGCLALMDAGVPIKNPIAGIAMGMLLGEKAGLSDENAIILSDITGTEDALGTMDFKVAGDRNGITTFQLDIKCEGLTVETMERALAQAKEGRLHILDKMGESLEGPRVQLPDTVPKMLTFSILPETIGKVIGPGGKQIRAIIEDFELEGMNVQDTGIVQISTFKTEKLAEVELYVKALVEGGGGRGGGRGGGGRDRGGPREERPKYTGPEPVEGQIYKGKIVGIHQFGVFVEFLPGAEDGSYPGLEGLCHVSELATDRIRNCEGYVRNMNTEELEVMYLGKNDRGKLKLSRKAVLQKNGKPSPKSTSAPKKEPLATMPDDELSVIEDAIESVSAEE